MEVYDLPNKEFKTVDLRKLNKLQEHTERQFKEIRKKIHKQNEKLNKETEMIRNQIMELKNTAESMKLWMK